MTRFADALGAAAIYKQKMTFSGMTAQVLGGITGSVMGSQMMDAEVRKHEAAMRVERGMEVGFTGAGRSVAQLGMSVDEDRDRPSPKPSYAKVDMDRDIAEAKVEHEASSLAEVLRASRMDRWQKEVGTIGSQTQNFFSTNRESILHTLHYASAAKDLLFLLSTPSLQKSHAQEQEFGLFTSLIAYSYILSHSTGPLPNRIRGGGELFFGALETLVGAPLWETVLGGVIAANGVNHMYAGYNQLKTGEIQNTPLENSLMKHANMSENTAHGIQLVADIIPAAVGSLASLRAFGSFGRVRGVVGGEGFIKTPRELIIEEAQARTAYLHEKYGSFTKHRIDRVIERGVKPQNLLDAIKNPLKIEPIEYDDFGRAAQTIIGRKATFVINPETKGIITSYPTKTKYANKLLRELERNESNTFKPQ